MKCYSPEVEDQIRARISLCIFAYAYECMDDPLVSDAEFDELSNKIDLSIRCDNFDFFWKENFSPFTGKWIRNHPDVKGIHDKYIRYKERINSHAIISLHEVYGVNYVKS